MKQLQNHGLGLLFAYATYGSKLIDEVRGKGKDEQLVLLLFSITKLASNRVFSYEAKRNRSTLVQTYILATAFVYISIYHARRKQTKRTIGIGGATVFAHKVVQTRTMEQQMLLHVILTTVESVRGFNGESSWVSSNINLFLETFEMQDFYVKGGVNKHYRQGKTYQYCLTFCLACFDMYNTVQLKLTN